MSFDLLKRASLEADLSDTEFVVTDVDGVDGADTDDMQSAPPPHEDAVTAANGWPLPEDGGAPFAACRAYLKAIHDAEWRTLQDLAVGEAAGLFDEGADFRILQGLRPASPSPVSGFRNATQATVTVQGVTRGGFLATWTYQLSLLGTAWRVERERWD